MKLEARQGITWKELVGWLVKKVEDANEPFCQSRIQHQVGSIGPAESSDLSGALETRVLRLVPVILSQVSKPTIVL